jgi:hypothetical protein
MSITLAPDGSIQLKGPCPVEDAEVLLQHLLANPRATVDWSACEGAHTAVIQLLLVAKSVPVGRPSSSFLGERIGALLERTAAR